MRIALAERLLAKTLDWTPEEISVERKLLQALGDFKYDGYHQFSPGIQFIESLMRWLKQFKTLDERRTAYHFVKTKLVFISNEQMLHLVDVAFSEKVIPQIIRKSADSMSISPYRVQRIVSHDIYKANLRKTLFIGLSDGSRIDQFRRAGSIGNEQVLTTYWISDEKAAEILKDLQKVIPEGKFNSIFLIDDFTASGKSFFRADKRKGKIYKFFAQLFDNTTLDSLIDKSSLDIHILFYVATQYSISNTESAIKEWQRVNSHNFKMTIDAVQLIEDSVREGVVNDQSLISLCKNHFDESIINDHYKVGKVVNPFLGFDECGLPLVLNHNTPNNSLPILWLPDNDGKKFRGLFPRVTRH